MQSIIVFSHLRWDFVYQRPQHLLSRLAKHFNVAFIEEPVFEPGEPHVTVTSPMPNLTVYRAHTPVEQTGYADEQIPYMRDLLAGLAADHAAPVVWFYTPMALPLLDALSPAAVVYDCMDELASFRNPPPCLLDREAELLRIADVVFTGGPSLYNAKKDRHPNVHCFPSSVDVAHFRQALDRNLAHPTQLPLSRPRLGYYGVIDERFDPDIVAAMAGAHPDWEIVLVGPVVKIDPASLPRLPNIHYAGQATYDELPKYLAAWDVCLMPFAMNESTRYISPTKSLEYMAAELPIVSTPVRDVVEAHGDVVEIASGPEEFIAACEKMLALRPDEMLARVRAMRQKLARTSWDATATKMQSLLNAVSGQRSTTAAVSSSGYGG
ncbi:glycosyltransferase [Noviherbaspirillum aridicola]|uniref:Glycosyl transferase n=1 Tax=Noviherbaspirillum aridicola TaxID=2849687 RepID=A0ABQ4Q9N4_9BURK|nr:glycosyltransferase [Noviherbaspirillum aridicola]GIZ53928.1 glycosyl transferase [Noviherbaspirillum aridicola]